MRAVSQRHVVGDVRPVSCERPVARFGKHGVPRDLWREPQCRRRATIGSLSAQSGHQTARRTGGLVENDPKGDQNSSIPIWESCTSSVEPVAIRSAILTDRTDRYESANEDGVLSHRQGLMKGVQYRARTEEVFR
jgi:hypothetical protein